MIANKDAAAVIASKLTGSQLRLWLYLMMADSFADRTTDGEKVYHTIPSPTEIALKIGASPETVEKDMRLLRKMGLYDHRITAWQGHNLAAENAHKESERLKAQKSGRKSKLCKDSAYLSPSDGLNKPSQRLNKPSQGLNKPSQGLNKPSQGLNNLSQSPEPAPSKASSSSQTIQTYSDFIQTLSDGEREKFLDFVTEQIKDFVQPINDLEAWLANKNKAGQNRWEVYYQNFKASPKKSNQATSSGRSLHEEIEQRREQIRLNLAKKGNY